MTIEDYIKSINLKYKLGNATEHTFRGNLEQLIESLIPGIKATNEPKRQKCGAPDYILTKKEIPIGFIEAKDIGDTDLHGLKKGGNKEQFDRYKASLNNLIFTDYLNFLYYREGQLITEVSVGEVTNKGIKSVPENYAKFEHLLTDFCTHIGQTIKSSKKLAEMMAGKARLLSEVIEKALNSDDANQEDSTLKDQMVAFREILIHDIQPKDFADVYAQTIAYGLFAARLHDPSIENFSRQEAAELIPKSNPFLRKLFGYIAGPDIDDRIKWIVDSLADIFLHTNVAEILKDFGKSTQTEDPIIHFYETFLASYDPSLRKARGVWYTPHPVVNFIVRAIDDILMSEFGIAAGVADNSKIKTTIPAFGHPSKGREVEVPNGHPSKGREVEVHNGHPSKGREFEVHRVQFLDPATGTATFLCELIMQIRNKFEGQEGIWSDYVEKHLIPRVNGFEILMASYAMAHLKLDLLLKQTGYIPKNQQRFKVYLTNSLEEYHADTGTLFANWLSQEANEANYIKRDTPVMIVFGNPPYSGESANKGEWIMKLMEDYKIEPGGIQRLNERNPKWINDDYVKFIRYGQHFIEKNGEGVLAFINPHGFLDNPTFRGMRWNLLKTFDKIFTIDLHGNAKKKETAPDGSKDENVFDIQQGVSINFFIKTGKKKPTELGKAFNFDLFGLREDKYDFLNLKTLYRVPFVEIPLKSPMYFMVQKDFDVEKEFDEGFSVNELFPLNNVGIVTSRDGFVIDDSRDLLSCRIQDFFALSKDELVKKYDLKENGNWKINEVKLKSNSFNDDLIQRVSYRPFDTKYIYYANEFIERSRNEVMKHLLKGDNFGLAIGRQGQVIGTDIWDIVSVSNSLIDFNYYRRGGELFFPLYLYPDPNAQQTIDQPAGRVPNLNMEIVNKIADHLGLFFVPEKTSPAPGDARNSPPSEGCPQGGVVIFPPSEGCPQGGVVISPPSEGSPKTTVLTTINSIPIIRNFVENLPYNPALKQRAREKRKAGILSEVLFWLQVHKGEFHKIDFDRQRIIGNYIVDFYVKTLGLVVEIDGSSHDNKVEYDNKRQQFLESFGLRVYRIADIDVKKNLSWVMMELEKYIVKEYGEEATLTPPFGQSATPVSGQSATPVSGQLATPPFGHPSEGGEGEFAPVDLLDYIYAVLHSPTYREKYKEFLKIDFPKVPYPKNKDTFWRLQMLGGELRQIHLLEHPVVNKTITRYPAGGSNEVEKVRFENCNVFINDAQYFANVPEIAWNFYIGGYQPAQKWLKDRKGRKLEFEDINHYQKIIVALTETDRIMKEIDQIDFE